MHDTYKKGQIAVMKVQLRAAEKGFVVSFPTTEARYDLILDDGVNLYRGQVKYVGRKATQGAVYLDLRKQTRNRGKPRPYHKNEIDVILVYIPHINEVLWVGPEHFHGVCSLSFRFTEPKNRQSKKIRRVSNFIW